MIEISLPREYIDTAIEKEWGGQRRVSHYASTDRKSAKTVSENRATGNISELAIWYTFHSFGMKCQEPNLETISARHGKWKDDIFADVAMIYEGSEIDKHITVKGQCSEMSRKVGGLSWTWQCKIPGRQEDPMLNQPHLKCLFAGVELDCDSILDFEENELKCRIGFFYWPAIYPYLRDPHYEMLKGKKKCIYYNDIKIFDIPEAKIREMIQLSLAYKGMLL